MNTNEERMRILKMVEEGRIGAEDAARLIAALGQADGVSGTLPAPPSRPAQWVRIRVTDTQSGRTQVDVNLPAQLVRIAGHFGARMMPSDEHIDVDEILEAVKQGAKGRLVDVYDHEEGTHVEVFVE
jgi:hypothetical protein